MFLMDVFNRLDVSFRIEFAGNSHIVYLLIDLKQLAYITIALECKSVASLNDIIKPNYFIIRYNFNLSSWKKIQNSPPLQL